MHAPNSDPFNSYHGSYDYPAQDGWARSMRSGYSGSTPPRLSALTVVGTFGYAGPVRTAYPAGAPEVGADDQSTGLCLRNSGGMSAMAEAVELLLGVSVNRDDLLGMVVALGGTGPDEWNHATLERDERTVWVPCDPDEDPEPESEQVTLAAERLGAPIRTRARLEYSTVREGSDRLALEVIEAAARRWPLIVDTLRGYLPVSERLVTVPNLRTRADAGKRYVFSEEAPRAGPATETREHDDGGATGRPGEPMNGRSQE